MPDLNSGQTAIMECLAVKPMTIQQLKGETFLSDSYVRLQLKTLEYQGCVEKTDERTPYIYQIPKDNPYAIIRKLTKEYKESLLTKDPTDDVDKWLKKYPKTQWPNIADNMEAASTAIRELNKEGKLIETLDP